MDCKAHGCLYGTLTSLLQLHTKLKLTQLSPMNRRTFINMVSASLDIYCILSVHRKYGNLIRPWNEGPLNRSILHDSSTTNFLKASPILKEWICILGDLLIVWQPLGKVKNTWFASSLKQMSIIIIQQNLLEVLPNVYDTWKTIRERRDYLISKITPISLYELFSLVKQTVDTKRNMEISASAHCRWLLQRID